MAILYRHWLGSALAVRDIASRLPRVQVGSRQALHVTVQCKVPMPCTQVKRSFALMRPSAHSSQMDNRTMG